MMKPIALVIPWYGDDIRGGAEQECNYLAHCLSDAGAEVEVFTTCVKDAASDRGKNTLFEGVFIESGIKVRRFKVRKRDVDAFAYVNSKIYYNQPYTLADEDTYFREDINSPEMYAFIKNHKEEYHCFIFIPYMYGPTYNGVKECVGKAIMIPCLHDESYAYMKRMKQCAESFSGMIFLSKPESDLAHKLYNLANVKTSVLGAGLDTDWHDKCSPIDFREKYKLHDDFILYAGRKDTGKKADELVRFFKAYKKLRPLSGLKLVLIGGGELPDNMLDGDDVIDLGFISVEDKRNAFAACKILCNPSHFESFSIVLMEGWVAKRPALVSEYCAVTSNFCIESNGGLFYDGFEMFCGCVDYLLNHTEEANQMGINGYDYVMNNFTHEKIAGKYLRFIEDL